MHPARFLRVGWPLFAAFSVWRGIGHTPGDLPNRLRQLDAAVLSPGERESVVARLEQDVADRLRESNARSSADWRSITGRAEWEQYSTHKLAALRNSLGQPAVPAELSPRVTGSLKGQG